MAEPRTELTSEARTEPTSAACTEAVPFDPFSDDEDDDHEVTVGIPVDSSTRARKEALTTFRERRGKNRTQRAVADGMVHLPFVEPTNPASALIESSDEFDPPVL